MNKDSAQLAIYQGNVWFGADSSLARHRWKSVLTTHVRGVTCLEQLLRDVVDHDSYVMQCEEVMTGCVWHS